MAYKTIIGLEIHVELSTKTKMFCNCKNEFGGVVNSHCCPVCLGLPGALPRINKRAIEYAIKAGTAFHCNIQRECRMDRKNYFYPDLVKGYQISQDQIPLCEGGYITIHVDGVEKKIHLIRIHIEEDTGKQIHAETGDTLIDYNRSGVPLIEIVSTPEMNTAEEARLFLEKLKSTLQYLGISDCKMEEGSLRCDVNVNIKDEETGKRSEITEIKNINSFSGAVKAIQYEEKRHRELLESGSNTKKETRRYDDVTESTILMREKVYAEEYRYIPEGDIAPILLDKEWVEGIQNSLPELPDAKKERFMKEYDLSEYDAEVLTAANSLADFYEEVAKNCEDPKLVSNWVMGDVLRNAKDDMTDTVVINLSAKDLSDLINMVSKGTINNNTGKQVLKDMFETGEHPADIVKKKGLAQISDSDAIEKAVDEMLEKNPQSVEDYFNGKDRAFGFMVGQVMKVMRGKANPQIVNELIKEKLEQMKK